MLAETLALGSFIKLENIKPLAEKLLKIRDGRTQEISRIADEFSDPLLLARYYIEPNCQHHNPADYHEDLGARADIRQGFFQFIDKYLQKEVLQRDGGQQLFILADAGMGKTSALMMLKLSHLTGFWPKGYDCVLLKLGPDTLDFLKKRENRAKTVLLLDALDEDPTAWGRIEDRIAELLHASETFRHVLITCRTQFFPATGVAPFQEPGRVTVGSFICPQVFLSLFDDAQVDAYLRKRFPDPWHKRLTQRTNPQRLRARKMLDAMCSLKFRPLLLAHIDKLVEQKDREWNPYTVYEALLETWLLREQRKLAKPVPSLDALWEACSALAVKMQSAGRRELPEADVKALVAERPALAAIERFDFGGRSLLNRNAKRDYRFAHYSIQEFLLVRGLPAEASPGQERRRVTDQMVEFLLGRFHDEVPLGWLDLSGVKTGRLAGLAFRDRLPDGRLGPAMVIIPGGRFVMGSPPDEPGRSSNEQQHEVDVSGFAMGRYAVSFDEYDRFADATGRKKPHDNGWGRGRRPVIHVSWQDAQAYCAWLSEQTGGHYRLPTEAEWEYACRADTTTPFHWGNTITPQQANYDGSHPYPYNGGAKGEYRQKTVPVDSFEPNSFGLCQMHGNVWEWCEDVWHDRYDGAPADGSAWLVGGGQGLRVLRGGSWFNRPDGVRSAYRGRYVPDGRNDDLGFRLARTL